MKILLVDDEAVFQDILSDALRRLGQHDVTKASSAAEALEILRSHSVGFDCIFLDIQMPDMDGISLCHVVRGLPNYRRVPIVMVTSQSSKAHIDDAFLAGATDYVTKPLSRLDLKARVGMAERLVEERRHVQLLTIEVGRRAEAAQIDMDFDSPMLVPDFDRGIEFMALENYLLTLGRKGLLSLSAFGFHVENAGLFFAKASRSGFLDMLGDVGLVISDALKTDDVHLAYAGAGNFVGVTSRELSASREEISTMIEIGLAGFEGFYSPEQLPTPKVRVGPMVKSPLFSFGSPTRILTRAILLAQQSTEKRSRIRGHAA